MLENSTMVSSFATDNPVEDDKVMEIRELSASCWRPETGFAGENAREFHRGFCISDSS